MLFVWIFDIMQIPALFRPWLKSDSHENADVIISHEYYSLISDDIFIYIE